MFECRGFATQSAEAPLGLFTIARRSVDAGDVAVEILYCGVCHSDLNRARNIWGDTSYPCLPGHEIVGRVAAVGADVSRFRVGEIVGVGVLVDSCRTCTNCRDGFEQYCENGNTETYNSPDRRSGGHTLGGYSTHIVVDQDFVLRIPDGFDPAAAAPLLCAGITTYSPLRRWGAGPGKRVAVVGLGGLGHVAVKIAAALGAEVVLFTTSPGKTEDAIRLGAKDAVISTDGAAMDARADSFDIVLDTVSAKHDLNVLLRLLKRDGVLVQVGVPATPYPVAAGNLIARRRSLAGSGIGGLAETQEMLDFCAANGIAAEIETISIGSVNEAFDRMLRGDVKYRFVIDMRSLSEIPA